MLQSCSYLVSLFFLRICAGGKFRNFFKKAGLNTFGKLGTKPGEIAQHKRGALRCRGLAFVMR